MSRRWFIRKQAFLLPVALVLLVGRLAAEELPLLKPDGPVSITAEKMTLKNREGRITFEHAVSIKQGDLRIKSDHAEVFLSEGQAPPSPGEEGEGREVARIVVTGNVSMRKGAQRAKADKGVYDREKEVIVLTGKPEVWDAGYRIKGKVITFFILEEKTLVSESRVVIHNGSEGLLRKKVLN